MSAPLLGLVRTPADYRHIKAWGWMMGSRAYYIEAEQQQAHADGAPLDAIYKRDGVWRRFADVERPDTREVIGKIIREMDP